MISRLFLTLLISMILILAILIPTTISKTTKVMVKNQEVLLKEIVDILAHGYEIAGESFIDSFNSEGYQITIIKEDRLNERLSLIVNKKEANEFFSALSKKSGIVSKHVEILLNEYILAGVYLDDNSIIIASTKLDTLRDTINEMQLQIILISIITLILALSLSLMLWRRIVKQLNNVDVDNPKIEREYKEIRALLTKIAEQKKDIQTKEIKLKRNLDNFNAISESLKEGLFLVNTHGNIIFINPSARRILNLQPYKSDELNTSLLPSSIIDAINSTADNSRDSILYTKQGCTYKVETTAIMSGESRDGTALLLYDITSQIEAENRRREFTANISHELKSPLHIISGYAELLHSGLTKDEDKQEFCKLINQESLRMKQIVDSIIKLSKIEETGSSLEKDEFELLTITNAVLNDLKKEAEKKGICFTTLGDRVKVYCNYFTIYSAIYNLADNAIKYSCCNNLTISVKDDVNNAYIYVEDDGIGIAEEYQERVFERFFRVDKSRSKAVGGSGLGLSIVKHACIKNDVDLKLESEVGKGSRFILRFNKINHNQLS